MKQEKLPVFICTHDPHDLTEEQVEALIKLIQEDLKTDPEKEQK